MRRIVLSLLCATWAAMPAAAQINDYHAVDTAPPKVPLWSGEANKDAVQKDMGFVFPVQWKTFRRTRFSSTRADGASVKVWYETPDKALNLAILLQLRVDVRGVDVDPALTWNMITMAADFEQAPEQGAKPEVLSSDVFSLGGREPAGRGRWARFALPAGPQLQGLWWQNIGIWSVVITVSGPEARKAEVEAAGAAVIGEMPFPSAPASAELLASGRKLFAAMPACEGAMKDGTGTGEEQTPTMKEAAPASLILAGYFGAKTRPPSPALEGSSYCMVERFDADDAQISAIRYTGKAGQFWDSRYGFALDAGRKGYFQFDRSTALAQMGSPPVLLTYGNTKRVLISTLLKDWPSYADAKKMILAARKKDSMIVTATKPAGRTLVTVNSDLSPTGANPAPVPPSASK